MNMAFLASVDPEDNFSAAENGRGCLSVSSQPFSAPFFFTPLSLGTGSVLLGLVTFSRVDPNSE
jgi:hypothetical protein